MPDLLTHDDPTVPGLRWVTLNRPEARNAYSDAMVQGLVEAFDAAEADDMVRVVALTGAGKAFSAGGDLKQMQAHSGMFEGDAVALRARYLRGIQQIPRRLARFDKPIIAAVNGAAVGAGLDLTCMADFRVATTQARFGSTFVKVGLVPGDGGAYFLARTIGYPRALEMILTGQLIDSTTALAWSLVNEVVAAADLYDAVRIRASVLCALPPIALRLTKSAAVRSWDLPVDQALQLAATYQGISQNTADHDEAVAAFLEKRAPVFHGK
ncbi:MAG: enoyl-CoA hydratase/carnithine racemase [Myxococcota bacterium]|jgi:enoyl-CoA hydratase/carnithine racemase